MRNAIQVRSHVQDGYRYWWAFRVNETEGLCRESHRAAMKAALFTLDDAPPGWVLPYEIQRECRSRPDGSLFTRVGHDCRLVHPDRRILVWSTRRAAPRDVQPLGSEWKRVGWTVYGADYFANPGSVAAPEPLPWGSFEPWAI